MITIDGSAGEGGGQIIRTALALALFTGKAFTVNKIRAGREKPGLQNQHLTCVRAAAEIGNAHVEGATLRANAFTFEPGPVKPGDYEFKVGTAGSTMLVLQTILPPLMIASGRSNLVLEGGTHNQHAPPFDFIEETFVPILNKMGPTVRLKLERYGFYPPGGGRVTVSIEPVPALNPLMLLERGSTDLSARSLVVRLPRSIAQREIAVLTKAVPELKEKHCAIQEENNALSPGNVMLAFARSQQLCETVTQIGERGVRAEVVAQRTADELNRYLSLDVAVGEHLADQLLLPLAMAGGGSFLTLSPSRHTTTNKEIVERFLDIKIDIKPAGAGAYKVSVQ